MAIILKHRHHAIERRDSTGSSEPVTQPLPTSLKALTGFIVLFGLIILGFIAWRVGKWRRKKIRAASQTIGDYRPKAASMSHAAFVHDDPEPAAPEKTESTYEPYRWQPIARPPLAHSPNKAVKKSTNRFIDFLSSAISSKASVPTETPPPPAYSMSVPPSPSPPTIVIEAANKPGRTDVPVFSSLTLEMLQTDPHPTTPMPSPIRTASIGPGTPLYKTLASPPKASPRPASGKPLPRLMIVASTFVPSLADELPIRAGEVLRMLEEYEDEWCLVQRVGKVDAERGVVPRFCLKDRRDAPPPSARKRNSLLATGHLS